MKQMKKYLTLLLAAAMLVTMTACGSVGKWIMKTDDLEVPVGVYTMYESVYYQYAKYYVSDSSKSPLKQDIKKDENTTVTGAQWIQENATDTVRKMVAVARECARLNLTLTDNDQKAIKENVESAWDSNSATYEKVGVSKASLTFIYENNTYNEKLFNYLYGEKGTDPVTDADVKAYFEKTYTDLDYFTVSLLDSNSKKLSDEEKAKIKTELDALAGEINSGAKTFEQAVTAYNKAHSNANVTGKSNTVIVGNTFSEAIATEITDCTEGKAIVASTDYYMYFISKNRIADASEEYLKTNLDSLRHEMKDTDFSDYVQKVLEGLSISVNSAAVNKYTPKWVENKTK